MAKKRFNFKGVKSPSKEKSWKEIIVDRLAEGNVVPIIGNTFTNTLAFGNHDDLIEGWINYIGYPLAAEGHNLAYVAQYESVSKAKDEIETKEKYLEFLKAALSMMAGEDPDIPAEQEDELQEQARDMTVSAMARFLNYPSLNTDRANPLLLLAALRLPVYVTTGYHNFLEVALKEKAGKAPRTEVYRWTEELKHIPSIFEQDPDYVPSPEEPLVYHLHGLDQYPESLVLTEDDHLDFLTNIAHISPEVMAALAQSSLVVLGFNLADWDFKVLFRGVIRARTRQLASVAIQLDDNPQQQEYLKKYLGQVNFEVEWTDPADPYKLVRELYQGWEG
jgi:hypothetical protein